MTIDKSGKSKAPLFDTKKFIRSWQLYVLLLLPLAYFFIFKYMPMYGAQIAFRKYTVTKGIWGSEWVGLMYFKKFFTSYNFWPILTNTLKVSLYQLIVAFPFPIIVALSINVLRQKKFKKAVQLTLYAPHFISVVVMSGLIIQFLDPRLGLINRIIVALGGTATNFMGDPGAFADIYVWSHIWQNTGWGTIIYLAALSGIDETLHEAAQIDGASRIKRIWHIDIPGILPTAVILLIMNAGRIMQLGFQKVLLLQNPLNIEASEVIQTYTYKVGLASQMANFSYSSAIGLFTSVINFILIITVNRMAKKMNNSGIW